MLTMKNVSNARIFAGALAFIFILSAEPFDHEDGRSPGGGWTDAASAARSDLAARMARKAIDGLLAKKPDFLEEIDWSTIGIRETPATRQNKYDAYLGYQKGVYETLLDDREIFTLADEISRNPAESAGQKFGKLVDEIFRKKYDWVENEIGPESIEDGARGFIQTLESRRPSVLTPAEKGDFIRRAVEKRQTFQRHLVSYNMADALGLPEKILKAEADGVSKFYVDVYIEMRKAGKNPIRPTGAFVPTSGHEDRSRPAFGL